MNKNWQTVFSPDTMLHWCGWRASIYDLDNVGYIIECLREPSDYGSHLIIKNDKFHILGMSEVISDKDHLESVVVERAWRGTGTYASRSLSVNMRIAEKINIAISSYGNSYHITRAEAITPGFCDTDLNLLYSYKQEQQDIIVEPETVAELLAKIRTMQEPRARELLRKQRTRMIDQEPVAFNEFQQTEVSARILTFRRA